MQERLPLKNRQPDTRLTDDCNCILDQFVPARYTRRRTSVAGTGNRGPLGLGCNVKGEETCSIGSLLVAATHKSQRQNRRRKWPRVETLEDRLLMAGDVVIEWNNVLLDAIRDSLASPPTISPPVASRALAIMHASIYDAVNTIDRTHESYLVDAVALPGTSPEAAAAAAAHQALGRAVPRVLGHLRCGTGHLAGGRPRRTQ